MVVLAFISAHSTCCQDCSICTDLCPDQADQIGILEIDDYETVPAEVEAAMKKDCGLSICCTPLSTIEGNLSFHQTLVPSFSTT